MILSRSTGKALSVSIALVMVLTSTAIFAAPTAAEPTEAVSQLENLPANRALPATAVISDKLYVIGGGTVVNPDIGGAVNTVMIYDIATGDVTYGTPMPIAVMAAGYGLGLDGQIYVAGGWTGVAYTQNVQVYDPVGDSWATNVIPISDWIGRSASTMGLDGKLYVFGGGWSSNITLIYTPETDSWLYGADVPAGSSYDATAISISPTEIMLMGGNPGPTSSAWIYDTVADDYTAVSPMNLVKRGGGGAFARNGYVYSFGGTASGSVFGSPQYDQMERYSVADDEWTVSNVVLPAAVSNMATAVDSYGRVFIVGGQSGAPVVSYVQMMIPMEVDAIGHAEITSPTDGSIVSGVVAVDVSLVNPSGASFIAVDLYVDGVFAETRYSDYSDVSFQWDTTGLPDQSTHTLMVRAFGDDGSVSQDSVAVTVWSESISDKIAALEQDIANLRALMASQDVNVTALNGQVAIMQAKLDGIIAGLAAMGAGQTAAMDALNATLVSLQAQLNDFQEQIDRIEDKADTGGTYGMITMVLVIIIVLLLAMMLVMSMKKKP